ncbi:hypothetical protein [Enterococcus songbeiensis]|uniref:hypothetical protein n=1 Tax=Enterococcus songbeiensis TaxID=2559927 RepID=UPI0010F77769|nr:hypothetical protein [Enterococcus songbeiensis]
MKITKRVQILNQLKLFQLTKEQIIFLDEIIQKLKNNISVQKEIKLENHSFSNEYLGVCNILLELKIQSEDNGTIKIANTFKAVEFLKTNNIVLNINQESNKVFNILFHNIKLQELFIYSKLESKYSKAFFLFLLEAEKESITIDFQLFKEIFEVPKTYRMIDLDKRVLDVIEKDMSSIYKEFYIKKNKKGRGGKVQSLSIYNDLKYSENSDISEKIMEGNLIINEQILINKLEDL